MKVSIAENLPGASGPLPRYRRVDFFGRRK
jgi:hypothetical protein